MGSVDSGVETGNDSNDSSIVQHENLTNGEISCDTTPTVATVNNNQKEEQENEQNTFRIEFCPSWPVNLNLPTPSLCPVIENSNYANISQNSVTNTLGELSVDSPQALELSPPATNFNVFTDHMNSITQSYEYCKRVSCYMRNMKSCHTALELSPPATNFNFFIDHMNAITQSYEYCKRVSCYMRKMRSWHTVRNLNFNYLMGRRLLFAASTNNIDFTKGLLRLNVSPNTQDRKGRTPLHVASYRGYTDMVYLLLEHGANPNKCDMRGNTPLHLAAVAGKISIVTLLLKAGTNVLSLDKNVYSPLQIAQRQLAILQNCKGSDILKLKEEVHNIVNMLLTYLQKVTDTSEQVENLSTLCSRLSLSNISDQVQDDVNDLLANINSLTITS